MSGMGKKEEEEVSRANEQYEKRRAEKVRMKVKRW